MEYDDKWHIGKGWVPLLEIADKVLGDINWIYKEKYGTLRIDLVGGIWDDNQFNLVGILEELSCHVCENCGAYGKATGGGWIKTLCKECEAELYEN